MRRVCWAHRLRSAHHHIPPEAVARAKREEANTFKLKPSDLLERMSLADIAQRELVYDPLGAAPQVPFGHAHAAWKKFTESLQPVEEIWRFSAQRTLS